MKNKNILIAGAVLMTLAVSLGAFGAHALKKVLSPEMLTIYHTGIEYHFYHALGLLLVGIIAIRFDSKWIRWSGILLLVGIVIFSGSLYLLALSGIKAFGTITPVGGLSFIAGWICLAIGISQSKLV